MQLISIATNTFQSNGWNVSFFEHFLMFASFYVAISPIRPYLLNYMSHRQNLKIFWVGLIMIIYMIEYSTIRPLQLVYRILVLFTLKGACGWASFVIMSLLVYILLKSLY